MKIAIVTNALYNPFPEYAVITNKLKRQYCGLHGIDYLYGESNVHPELHPMWCKPRIMLDAIKNYDWLVWMDADAAPVGMEFDIGKFLSVQPADKVVIEPDINNYNSGVFAISNGPRCITWMEYIESLRNLPKYQHGIRDNQAVIDSFKMPEWSGIINVPPREIGWNSYMDIYRNIYRKPLPNPYRPGDFVLHVPGASNEQRLRIFREFDK